MVVKFLAPAAVAGLLLSAMAPPPAVAQQAELATDSSFIQMAGSLGLLQVKLGQLAEKKGSSAGVTDFGKRMVAEYSKTNEELAAAAKQAAFPAPVVLREHKQVVDRFLGTSRSSFDKNYMAAMVDYDRQAVDLFKPRTDGWRRSRRWLRGCCRRCSSIWRWRRRQRARSGRTSPHRRRAGGKGPERALQRTRGILPRE
jgi:predicted outer membrane protein